MTYDVNRMNFFHIKGDFPFDSKVRSCLLFQVKTHLELCQCRQFLHGLQHGRMPPEKTLWDFKTFADVRGCYLPAHVWNWRFNARPKIPRIQCVSGCKKNKHIHENSETSTVFESKHSKNNLTFWKKDGTYHNISNIFSMKIVIFSAGNSSLAPAFLCCLLSGWMPAAICRTKASNSPGLAASKKKYCYLVGYSIVLLFFMFNKQSWIMNIKTKCNVVFGLGLYSEKSWTLDEKSWTLEALWSENLMLTRLSAGSWLKPVVNSFWTPSMFRVQFDSWSEESSKTPKKNTKGHSVPRIQWFAVMSTQIRSDEHLICCRPRSAPWRSPCRSFLWPRRSRPVADR